jgi:hypothetical protein
MKEANGGKPEYEEATRRKLEKFVSHGTAPQRTSRRRDGVGGVGIANTRCQLQCRETGCRSEGVTEDA